MILPGVVQAGWSRLLKICNEETDLFAAATALDGYYVDAVVKGAEAVKAYFEGATAATEAYHERILAETAAGKDPDEISRQLGIEVHEKTQLLDVEFFQKNCEQLVKQSLKYSQGD